jgi:hypothetical protein
MWIFAFIPTDPPGRRKIDHREASGGIGISHSSINGPCVSQICCGGCGIGRPTTSERVAMANSRMVHPAHQGSGTIEPVAPKGAMETYSFEQRFGRALR